MKLNLTVKVKRNQIWKDRTTGIKYFVKFKQGDQWILHRMKRDGNFGQTHHFYEGTMARCLELVA